MQLSAKVLAQIKRAALEAFPKEMCGFLLQNGTFILSDNTAKDPTKTFKPDPILYAKHWESTAAILHSHTMLERPKYPFDPRTPSYQDLVSQKRTKVPWGILATDGETATDLIFFPRVPNNNYLRRKFFWHINDCRTLVQDFFLYEFDLLVAQEYELVDLREVLENPAKLADIFLEGLGKENLIQVHSGELQKGDVLLMQALPPFTQASHIGVFDGEKVLHQELISKASAYAEVGGRVEAIYRHKEVEKLL
jgi:proteasome lid subunit RPN8/RPN11